jgi:hypothetical protein
MIRTFLSFPNPPVRICRIDRRRFASPRAASRPARLPALLVLAVCVAFAGCGGDDGGTDPAIRHPQDFVPTQVSGWGQDGEVDTGTTAAELEAIIDGGAEIYGRHGLQEFALADYIGSGAQAGALMKVWIFDMNSGQEALDLYDDGDLANVAVDEFPEVGNQARLSSSLLARLLEFRRETYYVRIEISGASSPDEARIQLLFFAGNIDQEMTE